MKPYIKEYLLWRKEHHDLLEELEEHEATLFDRIYPVLRVMDFLSAESFDWSVAEDDLYKIYQIGQEFLHDQIQTIRIYLEKVFQGDFHDFFAYEAVINYLLYVEDIRYEFTEKGYESIPDDLDVLLDELSEIVEKKQVIPDLLGVMVDERVKALASDLYQEFYSIIDIFMDVADTLNIPLYEEQDYLLGKEV